jgi:hypothetical protein
MAARVIAPGLRIGSTTRDPGLITEAVGAPCREQGRIGDLMSPRNPRSQRRKDNFCIFESPLPEGRPVSEHVIALAELLDASACDHTVLADCEMTLRFGIDMHDSQGCVTITPDAAASAAKHSLEIILDLYAG